MIGRAAHAPAVRGAEALLERYLEVRAATERLVEPLSAEDCTAQSIPEASPITWHLAHTSWFFETFVLAAGSPAYRPFHPGFAYLYNSYYDAVGDRVPRPQRGKITRPGLAEVRAYRRHVDEHVRRLLEGASARALEACAGPLEVGWNHEQQHQELLLADLKHLLSSNPLEPAYLAPEAPRGSSAAAPATFLPFEGGLRSIGHAGAAFAFDNEGPRHRVFTHAFAIASRPVTNGEFLAFVEDGGYERPDAWLSDGWDWVRASGARAPLHWSRRDGAWSVFTLRGPRPLDPAEPVCHVGFYEADAYARSAGARLPREDEWEIAAEGAAIDGNFVETGALHPRPTAPSAGEPAGLFGDVWEWTASPYVAYPGYVRAPGALGEYNGKFMSGRFVLRGGSCASPRSHLRATYRNFFVPETRWQFSGFRLARDA